MKRVYEELFIVRPDATEEEIDPLVEQLTNTIASKGGNVDKSEKWGIRKLAYRVKKHNEGNYVLLHFSADDPDAVREVERRLRVSDLVLKFITVRIDQKMKKIDKRRKAREKRAARRPAPPVAAPSMPSAEGLPMPGAPGAGPTPGAPMPGAPVAQVSRPASEKEN